MEAAPPLNHEDPDKLVWASYNDIQPEPSMHVPREQGVDPGTSGETSSHSLT